MSDVAPTNLERQLAAGGVRPQLFANASAVPPARLEENLLAVQADLDAPRETWLTRTLRRLGVPDLAIPLVTATPALRRSWFAAVTIAVLFALTVSSNNAESGLESIGVFLTLAPLVPLLGVALAFGRGVDPTHDLVVAAPRDTFTVFLIRALTVLVASSVILLLSSLLLPEGGVYRVAWMLPALALTALTISLAARHDARRVAAAVGAAWIVLSSIVLGAGSVPAMFGAVTQVAAAVTTGLAWLLMSRQRERFETGAGR